MTRSEAIMIFNILKAAYPNSYKGMTKDDANNVINLWCDMFDDEDDRYIGLAVKAFITSDTKGFPPTIGQLKNMIYKLKNPDEMTEQEAWNHVMKALSNSLYNAEEEFKKLPEVIQRILGNHKTLKEWAMIDRETLSTVTASNFMRSYKARAKNEREYLALPQSVRDVAKQLGANMNMERLIGSKEDGDDTDRA